MLSCSVQVCLVHVRILYIVHYKIFLGIKYVLIAPYKQFHFQRDNYSTFNHNNM